MNYCLFLVDINPLDERAKKSFALSNENAHIGSVAVGEYNFKENRTSTSVITRLGHKDDAIAHKAAYFTKHTKQPSCVVAGVHVDKITKQEIQKLLENSEALVKEFLKITNCVAIMAYPV